jgi:hypothetical protein
MKPNLKYNWRITLSAPFHSISVIKFCTLEQALLAANQLETEVEWIVTLIGITRET